VKGETFVVIAKPTFELLARNPLREAFIAYGRMVLTPIF
jgi:hypothetical protein